MRIDTGVRALNRFGLGARLTERDRLADPRGWLRAQVEGDAPALGVPANASSTQIGEAIRAYRLSGRASEAERRAARQRLVQIGVAEIRASLTERVTTDRPFMERLISFWSNHLCVSAAGKLLVAPLAGAYERDVIRANVLGRFEDMLLASARHPAMLIYLDNAQSIGPASPAARMVRRRNAAVGLNENYARELLELHTLGVDGGYTQKDVYELARVLTGWTISGYAARGAAMRRSARTASGALEFAFEERLHEPGAKAVLGVRYDEAGEEEGKRVIRALVRHPSTARFLATKLVTHFVSDNPPAGAVERIARVFRETDGDLRAVSLALVELPEAWSDTSGKFRTPQDWLVAVLRAFSARAASQQAPLILRQLRHPVWSPQSPKGFADTTREWADPDSLLNRAELARTISKIPSGRAPDPQALSNVIDMVPADPLHRMLADTSIEAGERVALAIAGPAFHWR